VEQWLTPKKLRLTNIKAKVQTISANTWYSHLSLGNILQNIIFFNHFFAVCIFTV